MDDAGGVEVDLTPLVVGGSSHSARMLARFFANRRQIVFQRFPVEVTAHLTQPVAIHAHSSGSREFHGLRASD